MFSACNLFVHCSCFTFICKYESDHAFITSKGMKEGTIHVIFKRFPYFVFPDDATGAQEIYELEAKAARVLVHGECESTL